MREKTLFAVMIALLSVSTLYAQDVPTEFVAAFKKGSAQELSRYMGNRVELVIQRRSMNTDKRTAENYLATFFAQNRVSSFTVNHQGKRNESSFMVGTLTTSGGNYRVNCFFKRTPTGGYLINQIRIDKNNE